MSESQDFTHAITSAVRAEAAARRISMSELARMVDVSQPTIYRYMDGRRDMPVSVLWKITHALGITPTELVESARRYQLVPATVSQDSYDLAAKDRKDWESDEAAGDGS